MSGGYRPLDGLSHDLDILTMAEASALCGRRPVTMRKQALAGKLRARKVGKQWVTTRRALSAYLALVAETDRRRHMGILRRTVRPD